MRRMRVFTLAIAILMVLVSMTGFAMGAITTTGSLSDTSSLIWTISSGAIDGVLEPGERQATTTYTDTTLAAGGTSRYMKSFSLDTGGMYQNQYNVDSLKMFTFEGDEGGSAISEETIGIETEGMPGANDTRPAYHNTVNAGSSFSLLRGSVMTEAQTRTVGASPALNYRFSLFGF